ncbi:hypothetical protein Tco_0938995 [Tanacetum coccineum]|uniref:Uncharacterized protein n=1 Tax=Tanacetum coccineum TaxID=301880 RepID=A0ABQ5DJD5_9ASTR
MTIKKAQLQLKETKRLANLKAAKDKSEEKLKMLTPEQLKAHKQVLTEIETQRTQHMNKIRDEYLHCISFRADPLPITKFLYRVNKSTKIASMRITRNNQPLNYRAKFKWIDFTADKLGIPPPLQLIDFELPPTERKRKRRVEMVKEVFVLENIVVDGMDRNLAPPQGIVASVGLAIKEPEVGVFFYNENLDLVFQRRSGYNLATTPQLIKIQDSIKIDLEIKREMYDELIWVIESRPDVVKARKIVEKNLDGLGMD